MSRVESFALGNLTFEVAFCTDPSTGHESVWVYRTDPRALVATGDPESLRLTPAYQAWGERVAVLEQAVMDCIEGALA